MSRSVSSTLTEQIFAQDMDEVVITLIEITHDDLSEPIYVSSDPTETLSTGVKGTISNSIEYAQIPFQLTLQEQTDNLLARAKLSIDNINREIMLAIRQANNSPPNVTIKIVLASDPDTVEIEIPNLQLNNITGTAAVVEGELQPKILQGETFPRNTFNKSNFPGVFGASA